MRRARALALALGVSFTSACTHGNDKGDLASVTGCLETRSALGPTQSTTVGVSADQALQWLGTQRSAMLTWHDGSNAPPTEITFSFSERRALFVHSKRDPDFTLDIVVSCEDHVEVQARMSVSTADGKLRLDKDKVRLTAEMATSSLWGTIGSIDAEDLRGSYSPARANECFLSTQLNVSFSADELSGTMTDAIAGAACSALNDLTGVGPRDGAQW